MTKTKEKDNGELCFNMDFETKPVKITVHGKTIEGELRELDGRGRDAFLTEMNGRMGTGDDGKRQLVNFDGLEASLLCKCLYDGRGQDAKLISQEIIQSWPGDRRTKLFQAAQELSGLDEGAKTTEGNG